MRKPSWTSTTTLLVHVALLTWTWMALESRINARKVQSEPISSNAASEREPNDEQDRFNHNEVAEGIEQFNRELNLNPRNLESLIDRGWSYSQIGKYKEAVADLTLAIQSSPRNSEARSKRAWVYITVGQFREALRDANTAISLDKHNSDALDARYYAIAQLRSPDAPTNDAFGHDNHSR